MTVPVIPFGIMDAIETTVEGGRSFSLFTWYMLGVGILLGILLGGASSTFLWTLYQRRKKNEHLVAKNKHANVHSRNRNDDTASVVSSTSTMYSDDQQWSRSLS
jgi:hypothetical protein